MFIGATTENPSFEINAALLSRCRVLTLNKLQPEHIRSLLDRAIADKDKGLLLSFVGSIPGDVIKVEEDALQFLASAADGDARAALNSLEIAGLAAFAALESTPPKKPRAVPSKPDEKEPEPVKQETPPSTLAVATNLKMNLSGNGFGIKRLEVLKENLKKENPQNSTDDYTKPFKRFVGGKEVVKGVKELKERSPSGETQGDSGGYLHDDMWEKDGTSERVVDRTGDAAAAGEAGGSGSDPKKDHRKIVVTLQQVLSSPTSYSHPVLPYISSETFTILLVYKF